MVDGHNDMSNNRSMLRDFIASIATINGDLSNITAPPFVLDTKSTVELPRFWAENPSIFCAPAKEEDPAVRALLVLKWYLSCLRNQNYMGRGEADGVKKPLNAFLGEVFLGRWEDEMGTTRLVSEQVSHHPPITACRVWNEEHGVSASGYTRQTITFSGSVTIKQTGHATFTLSKLKETYLIPLPELKVKGVLTGSPYPELSGKYYIPSTNKYMSVVNFSGKGWFGGGSKHALEAKVFHEDQGEDHPIYILRGTWNGEFTIYDVRADQEIERFDVVAQSQKFTNFIVDPLEDQDPWESRKAWAGVIDNLCKGDMKGVVDAKAMIEKGQRQMRKDEQEDDITWKQVYFSPESSDNTAAALMAKIPGSNHDLEAEIKETKGIWTFNEKQWQQGITKPCHGELMPDNSHRETPSDTASDPDSRRNSTASSAGGWRWSFSSRRSSVSAQSSSSIPSSRKQSIDAGRKSSDLGPSPLRDSSIYTSEDRRPSKSSPLASRQTQDGRQGASQDLSHLATTIHKNMPEPQVEQVFHSEEAKIGSGIEGMTLNEKIGIEEQLRNAHSTMATSNV